MPELLFGAACIIGVACIAILVELVVYEPRKYKQALEAIASYEGFEDGAIILSGIARRTLGWEDYQ